MACLVVPATQALIVTIATKSMKKKVSNAEKSTVTVKNPFIKRINWLTNLLWGGSALLAFEHVWHGEIIPFFPFLTATANPEDAIKMLYEMGTSGVAMSLLVTAVWAGMVLVTNAIEKRTPSQANSAAE